MGIGFLARPWLTADRRLQFGRYVQLMRAKDGRQPMFELHENGTKYV